MIGDGGWLWIILWNYVLYYCLLFGDNTGMVGGGALFFEHDAEVGRKEHFGTGLSTIPIIMVAM